jgi:hypothetical protein
VVFAYPTHLRALACLRWYHISLLQQDISPYFYNHEIRNTHVTPALTGSQAHLAMSTGWNIMHSNPTHSPHAIH